MANEQLISAGTPPTVSMGDPAVVSTFVEVLPSDFTENETSYSQTIHYRKIVEYEVEVSISK
jgi:hypothetical protein